MKLFTLSLFALGAILTSNTFAATGTGHAQVELTAPLTVTNFRDLDFGTIAIDPAAGPQTLSMNVLNGIVTCPATYVCTGSPDRGIIQVSGAPDTPVNIDITGSTATLDDGSGNQLIFDPLLSNQSDTYSNLTLPAGGSINIAVAGDIDFTGNETAGTYTTYNGSGYTVTVNY